MSRVHILVVTHGKSGAEMVAAVHALVGAADPTVLEDFAAVEVPLRANREAVAALLGKAVAEHDAGAGVLVAVDLHGSTPHNVLEEMAREGAPLAVISGVNLPMLIKMATTPREGQVPGEVGERGAETGLRSIRLWCGKVQHE